MPRNPDCVVAGSAQDVELPSQAAVNGHSPLRRAFTVKKGPLGPKPVVVDIPYLANSYLRYGALGIKSQGAAAYIIEVNSHDVESAASCFCFLIHIVLNQSRFIR
ncbi:MAG: hypothetical protein ACFFER_05275 [Candidatus Thorarchaeota archaeon]